MQVRTALFAMFFVAATFSSAVGAQNSGYYRRVTPPPAQPPPCGHIGMPPCPAPQSGPVTIPPNATPDQVYQLALQAQRRRDISAKMQYMERAAAMGQINAMTGFGVDLVYGKDVAPDLDRGLALLEKAAARNHPAALYQLGSIYDNDAFERHNTAKAAQLMSKAAQARYFQAEFWMGVAYEVGRGVSRSRQSALALLDRAAADGQAGMPQMIAAYLRAGGANKRFANPDELNAAFNADFHDQYNGHYFPPGGDPLVPGSREWMNRITGNSTACYFGGVAGCPKR